MTLEEAQALFWQAVRAKAPPTELTEVFASKGALSAKRRMQIYRSAYWARHEKCLKETYPCVLASLGEHAFRGLVASYIERNPSRSFAIELAGRAFPLHLATHAPESHDACALSELAAIEWARLEVALAPDELRSFDLAALGAQGAADKRLRMRASLLLLRVCDTAFSAFSAGALHPRASGAAAARDPEREACFVAVWRGERGVREERLEAASGRALERALRGESFAAVCAELSASDEASPRDQAQRVSAVLGKWIRRGWITALEAGDART